VGQYGGMILTGLASSAGSSFWHDMLGRARNLKDAVKQVENIVGGDKDESKPVG
jgi:accessory colonization factor AcfC